MRKFNSARSQHEYRFLAGLVKSIAEVDRSDVNGLEMLFVSLVKKIERRGAMLIIGDQESWETAQFLDHSSEDLLDEFKDELKAAREKSKSSHSGQFFRFGGAGRAKDKGKYQWKRPSETGSWKNYGEERKAQLPDQHGATSQQAGGRKLACYVCGGEHFASKCQRRFGAAGL